MVVPLPGILVMLILIHRLRRLDESATIVMYEKGSYVSFANCGLPYYVGNVITDVLLF